MRELKAASGAAIILITHDLGVVAEVCDEVAVMYAGEIVERAPVDELFAQPQHPYTVGLLGSIPRLDRQATHLATIEGMVPNMTNPPAGCRFAARCPFAGDICVAAAPPMVMLSPGHWSRCIKAPAREVGVVTTIFSEFVPRARRSTSAAQCCTAEPGSSFGSLHVGSRFCSASLHAAQRPGHDDFSGGRR